MPCVTVASCNLCCRTVIDGQVQCHDRVASVSILCCKCRRIGGCRVFLTMPQIAVASCNCLYPSRAVVQRLIQRHYTVATQCIYCRICCGAVTTVCIHVTMPSDAVASRQSINPSSAIVYGQIQSVSAVSIHATGSERCPMPCVTVASCNFCCRTVIDGQVQCHDRVASVSILCCKCRRIGGCGVLLTMPQIAVTSCNCLYASRAVAQR